MSNEVLDKVTQVIEDETGIKMGDIDPDADIREQTNIDSMQFVAISVAIENALDIELPITVMKARTFNAFMELVREQVGKKQ